MTAESSGRASAHDDRQRFALPVGKIALGRSQPKRKPPQRRTGNPQLLQRIASGVAAFGVALVLVSIGYALLISMPFAEVVFENGATTAAVALLIGCFALPAARRVALNTKQHLAACIAVLTLTPWAYDLSNQMNDAGAWIAPGLNFVFEILLAVLIYRLIARRSLATEDQ